jgi:hypothetical protein
MNVLTPETAYSAGAATSAKPDHYVFHDEVHLAEGRLRALALKDLEEIAVIGLGAAVALLDRIELNIGASPGSS